MTTRNDPPPRPAGASGRGDPPAAGRPDNAGALILLSGGLDSATILAIARDRGFVCHTLTFDYGQRHRVELAAAGLVAEHLGVPPARRRVVRLDLRAVGHSALTADIPVPKDRPEADLAAPDAVPVTYVPARNTIFLAYALAVAETLDIADLFLGVNALDYSGYPDCRPAYLRAFARMANLATRAALAGRRLTIHAPLVDWPKTRIIQEGLRLGVDYRLTHSCYDPAPDDSVPLRARACGRCDACRLRKRAFAVLGLSDPAG